MNRSTLGLRVVTCTLVVIVAFTAAAAAARPFDDADRAAAISAASPEDAAYLVRLDSRVFLPRGKADLVRSADEKVFVQFTRTLTGDERDALQAAGVVFHESLEPFTYLVSLSPSAVAVLERDPLLRGLEPMQPSDKISASLYLDVVPAHARRPGGAAAVDFRFYDGVALEEALAVLDGAGVSIADRGGFLFGSRIEATAKREQILAACESPLVRAVFEISPPPVTTNSQAAGISNVPPVNIAPYNLTGSGIALGIWDGGQVRATHQDLTPRVTLRETDRPLDPHSCHVTGTMIGSGFGNANAKGMAPAATVYSWDFLEDVPTEQAGSVTLAGDAIVASNHSWAYQIGWIFDSGSCTWTDSPETFFGLYTAGESQVWDALVRTKKLVVLKAAANEGTDCGPAGSCLNPRNTDCDGILGSDGVRYDIIDPVGIAKNVITVGAINDDGTTKANFSSAGPADDGRVKPDVVANGVDLTSTGDASDTAYLSGYSGTSMATPVVSGIVALIDQAWKNLYTSRSPALNKPTPELVKALLINTATDLGRPGPDYAYGHGLVKAKEAIDQLQLPNPSGGSNLAPNQVRIAFVGEGEAASFKLSTPAGPTGALRLTTVWTDLEGTSGSVVRYCNFHNFKVVCAADATCQAVHPASICLPAACGATTACNLKNDLNTYLLDATFNLVGAPWIPPGIATPTNNAQVGQPNHLDNVEVINTGSFGAGGVFNVGVFGFTVGGRQRFALAANKPLTYLPPSDNFANARVLPALLPPDPAATDCASGEVPCPATLYSHNTWEDVNFDGTLEAGEPLVVDVSFHKHSVWLRWVAPANGLAVFDTLGADYDTLLGVYTGGAVNSLTQIAVSDDVSGTRQSRVTFTAVSGTTYSIAVSGYQAPAQDRSMGVFPLNYSLRPVCGNGVLDIGEPCDDGNTSGGDCCSATCTFEAGGAACNVGGNVCTPGACNGTGGCTPGAPLVCTDGNVCTTDGCNPATGCVFPNNTAPCDDGNSCTTGDTCGGGACLGGPPPAVPGASTGLVLQAGQLSWPPIPSATGYDVVRGNLGLLRSSGGNFQTATTNCLADNQAPTSASDASTPAAGAGFFYLVRAVSCSGSGTYNTGHPKQVASRDAGVDAAPITCGTACARNKCTGGPPFDGRCGGCVAAICAADPFCCNTSWDSECIKESRTVCGSLTCAESAGACLHPVCATGALLAPNCDSPPVTPSCVTSICTLDSFCCNVEWDFQCTTEVATQCAGFNCN